MKKILTILLIICYYSCTLFSQNSMNEIKDLEQKIDSIDNLINHLDPINYPVPQDKLNYLKNQRAIAYQKYTACQYSKPKNYSYDRKNFVQGLGIAAWIVGPLLGTAIVVSNENGTIKNFKKINNNYIPAALACFGGIPILGSIPIVVSNMRYRKSKVKRNNYNFEIEAKKSEVDRLDNQIEAEKDYLRKLKANKYEIRKSELEKERNNLVDKLTETLKNNNLIAHDTITTFDDTSYYDYNTEYLYGKDLIPEKYFLIKLDTIATSYGSIDYINRTQNCYIKVKKNIKLKKGRYLYTTDTLRKWKVNKFGNYYYINIPVKFKYNINYNGNENEITMKAYKNNKLIDISYSNSVSRSKLTEIAIKIDILEGRK